MNPDLKESKNIRVYQSGQGGGWHLEVWREMFAELGNSRELIWRLFLRNFRARYRKTVLGLMWPIVLPIITVGTFIFLNRAGVMNLGQVDIPYPAFALLGLTIWQIFAGGLTECTKSIEAGGSMVVKVNFPKESLVISSFGDALVGFLIRLALTIFVFAIYKVVPAWTAIFFPLALIPLFLLTLGIGLIFALLNAVLRDVANIVSLSSMFLLFITPVLYPEPKTVFFKTFSILNPLSVLVTSSRDLVLEGRISHPGVFLIFSLMSLVFFFVAWRLFHLVEKRIAERIGGR